MTRGQPDFGLYAPKNTLSSMADLGELAIRLGAISSVDRKGSAIALDDFESPLLKWVTAATSGGSVTLGTTSVRSGSQAIKLFATNSVGAHATIRKYLLLAL